MSSLVQNQDADGGQLLMFVVDVLRHDMEPLSSVIKMLNNDGSIGWRGFWPHDFTEAEAGQALDELVNRKWVEVLEYSQPSNQLVPAQGTFDIGKKPSRLWFRLTEAGRQAWEDWKPPTQAES